MMIAILGALAGCDRCDPPAGAPSPGAASANVRAPLRDHIQGVWAVRPARSAVDKARADLRKAARGDEQKLEEMVRSFEQSTAGTSLEITADALITRAHDRQVGTARYEVLREDARTIVLLLPRAREQALTLEPDGTLSTDLEGLGPVTLERRR